MHDPRRPRRGVAHDPIVHGLSKREKKKKRAKCREFVECLQSTTASRVRLHGRIPPSYPVECDCPPNRAGHAIRARIIGCSRSMACADSCAGWPPCGTVEAHSRSSAFRHDASVHVRTRSIPAAVRLAAAGVRASVGPSSSCRTAARRRRAAPAGGTRRLTSRLSLFRFPFARLQPFVRRHARRVAARATWNVSIRSTGGFTWFRSNARSPRMA